jgi:hypothetical protein
LLADIELVLFTSIAGIHWGYYIVATGTSFSMWECGAAMDVGSLGDPRQSTYWISD